MDWVLPGVELVLANFFLFTRVLMREDLPTLDLPAKAISGLSDSGYWLSLKALIRNSTSILTQTRRYFHQGPLSNYFLSIRSKRCPNLWHFVDRYFIFSGLGTHSTGTLPVTSNP